MLLSGRSDDVGLLLALLFACFLLPSGLNCILISAVPGDLAKILRSFALLILAYRVPWLRDVLFDMVAAGLLPSVVERFIRLPWLFGEEKLGRKP